VAITTISLPDDQLDRLRQHALASGRSLDELVGEAVGTYLSRLPERAESDDAHQRSRRLDAEGQVRVGVGADGMRVPIPPAMSVEEADHLLAAPSPQARREILATWLEQHGARVIQPTDPSDPARLGRAEGALAQIHARVPADMTSDEIEQLITEVSEEARRERIARRASGD
jgi:hypothetical protein